MSPDALAKQVADAFARIMQDRRIEVKDLHEDRSFGNAIVVLESPDLRVRVVRDRDRLSLETCSLHDPERWFDFDIVMQLLDVSARTTTHEFAVGEQLSLWATLLHQHYDAIRELFSQAQYAGTRNRLEVLEWKRARAMFGDHIKHLGRGGQPS